MHLVIVLQVLGKMSLSLTAHTGILSNFTLWHRPKDDLLTQSKKIRKINRPMTHVKINLWKPL